MSMGTASHRCKPSLFTDDLTAARHIHGRVSHVPFLYFVELAAGVDTHEPFSYTLKLPGKLTDNTLQNACCRL